MQNFTHAKKITTCFHESPKTVNKMYKDSAKSVVEHVHKQVAIENGTNTKFVATGKDVAIRDYNLFLRVNENG
jgi:hypothetical protein